MLTALFPPLICSKSFEEPTVAEGFTEVITVDFYPDFTDERAKTLFAHWQETDF